VTSRGSQVYVGDILCLRELRPWRSTQAFTLLSNPVVIEPQDEFNDAVRYAFVSTLNFLTAGPGTPARPDKDGGTTL
jgi:hypothetical protein